MKLFLTGGFLGSGKTTAIREACALLLQDGTRAAVITNDQGEQIVDTEFIKANGIPTQEVTEGCFCCKYDKLERSIETLLENNHPEVIFAESVGSCTDLVATVIKPLQKLKPGFDIVISVFADARLLPLQLQGSRLFSNSINYIYKKQLEEADVLVINKIDLISPVQLQRLKQLVERLYPGKTVLYQNSLMRENIRKWMDTLFGSIPGSRESLELDYDIYGAGEAELAWLDAEVEVIANHKNAIAGGRELIGRIHSKIVEHRLPIGHLKFLISDDTQQLKISFTATDQTDFKPDDAESGNVRIIVNARVQTDPEILRGLMKDAVSELKMSKDYNVIERRLTAFKPGFPRPAHRIS